MGSDCGQCSIPAFHSLATFSQYPRAKRLSIREKFCRAFPSNCRFFQQNRRISRTALASVSSQKRRRKRENIKTISRIERACSTFFGRFLCRPCVKTYRNGIAVVALRWLDTVFQGQFFLSLRIKYITINNDFEKLPLQLY